MAQHLFGIQQDGKVRALAVRLTVDRFVRTAQAQQSTRTGGLSFLDNSFVCLVIFG